MRLAILLLLSTLPAFGAEAAITLRVDDAYVATYTKGLELTYLAEADANANGAVNAAEALGWTDGKAQGGHRELMRRLVIAVESQSPQTLPAAHQTALTNYLNALAALEAERAKAVPAQ